jgi:hypothetical protein
MSHQFLVKFSNIKIHEDSFRCSELLRVYRQIIGQCDFHTLSVWMWMCLKQKEKLRKRKGDRTWGTKDKPLKVMSVHNYQTTWWHIPGPVTFTVTTVKNLKSHTLTMFWQNAQERFHQVSRFLKKQIQWNLVPSFSLPSFSRMYRLPYLVPKLAPYK